MFWDILWKFVLFTAAWFCLGLWVVVARKTSEKLKQRARISRGRKAIATAKKVGALLYYNDLGLTLAICRVNAFKATERLAGSRSDIRPWKTSQFIQVRPTLLFCEDEAKRSRIHVNASKEEVKEVGEILVEQTIGYRKDQVSKEAFRKAGEILIRKNSRLFVPFAFGEEKITEEEGNKLLEFYGSAPTFENARHYMLQG